MPLDPGTLPFRKDQLIFRRHEIYLAYSAFSSFVGNGHNTENSGLQTIDGSQVNLESWFRRTSGDLPRVRCDADVALVGHSFGGATVVSPFVSAAFNY
jgi:platelet-activating factor acetylhydrolase